MPDPLIEILTIFITSFTSVLILILIAFYLQLILHEGGHLVFGLITKYDFQSFRVGSLMIVKNEGKLKFKKFSLTGTGGQCIMIPPDFVNGKIPYVLYNAGGAIFNIVSSLLFMVIISKFNENEYFLKFAIYFIFFGIILGLVNIIPFKSKLISNDGKNILAISKSKSAEESFWRMLKVHALLNEGIRVKDMPDELFLKPSEADLLNTISAIDGYTYAVRLLDKEEFTEAKTYIEYLLNKNTALVGLHKSLLSCELIYCNLLNSDFEAIDKLLTKRQLEFSKKAKSLLPVLRIQYLLALIKEKDSIKAEKYFAKFDKLAKGYSIPVEAQSEYELIDYALSTLNMDTKKH